MPDFQKSLDEMTPDKSRSASNQTTCHALHPKRQAPENAVCISGERSATADRFIGSNRRTCHDNECRRLGHVTQFWVAGQLERVSDRSSRRACTKLIARALGRSGRIRI